AEFLIGGYTRGQGAREPLGALLLGYWEGKSLRYAGHVGSGLDDEIIGALLKRAARLERRTSPFADPPPLHRPTRWLKPELVAEVSFSEWTPGGALRAPVFVRLREDIAPRSVHKRAADAASRHDQAGSDPLSGRRRALHAAAPCGPAADHDPYARGDRWRALLSEALGAGAAGVRRVGHGLFRPQGREAPLSARQQSGHPPV